jgi:Anti-sigma-K factor rskA
MPQTHPGEILSLPSESFADALRRLDPASRALLDLSLRRGMRPDEIADLLGADAQTVVSSRDHALEHVAADLGSEGQDQLDEVRARLAEMPADVWLGAPRPGNGATHAAGGNVVALPGRATVRPGPEPTPERRRPALGVWLLAALAVAGGVVAIVLATTGGGSSSKSGRTPSAPPAQAPATRGATLSPVGPNGAGAKGTASIAGGRLQLDVRGLPGPRGGATYEAWLYNSVIDAQPLGSSHGGHVAIDAKLPAGATRYRYVDVSLEPADGNPSHSGDSVVRVALAKLR